MAVKNLPKESSFSGVFRLFKKADQVRLAILNLRQRSKFRKPNKLKTFHYKLIDDKAFFKKSVLNGIEESTLNQHNGFIKKSRISFFCMKIMDKLPIFQPNSLYKSVWDLFILLLAIMEFFIISIHLSFGISLKNDYTFGFFFKFLAFFCFSINIMINFNKTYYEYGDSVPNRKKITKNYLNTNFFFDLIALLSLIPTIILSENHTISYISIFFILIFKSLKKIICNLEETYQTGDLFDLLSLIFKTIFLAHVIACIWHALAFFSIETTTSNQSWLIINSHIDLNWQNRYLLSIYWAFTTLCTVGYGDITPQNNIEMGFCCFVMVIGTFGFGYCVNAMGTLLHRMEERSKEFDMNMKTVDNYMKRKNINQNLKIKVKKYLEFLWRLQNENAKEEEIIEKLPISMRNEILLESNIKPLRDFSIISENFSEELLKILALNLKPIQFSPTDLIYSQGSFEDPALFLLLEGEIELSIENPSHKPMILKKLHKGDFFGERSFFLNSKNPETAQTRVFSTVYKISRVEFLKFLAFNPKDHEKFCEIRDQALFSKRDDQAFCCYSCNKTDHLLEECPLLRYIPDKLFLLQRLNFTKVQTRAPFRRKKLKKNTLKARKDVLKNALKLRFSKSLMLHFYKTAKKSKDLDEESQEESSSESQRLNRSKSVEFFGKNLVESLWKIRKSISFDANKTNSDNMFCPDKAEIDQIFQLNLKEKTQEKLVKLNSAKKINSWRKSSKISLNLKQESNSEFEKTRYKTKQILGSHEPFYDKKLCEEESSILSKLDIKSQFMDSLEKNSSLLLKSIENREKSSERIHFNNSSSKKMKNKLKIITMNNKFAESILSKKFSETIKSNNNLPNKTLKEENKDEILKNLVEKRALFWQEFEKMKEFNGYIKENNASNVIRLGGIAIAMKNKSKKNIRKSVWNPNAN